MNKLDRAKVSFMTRRARIRRFTIIELIEATRPPQASELCDKVISQAIYYKAHGKARARSIFQEELNKLVKEGIVETETSDVKNHWGSVNVLVHYKIKPLEWLALL
jgi:hypothetical protein